MSIGEVWSDIEFDRVFHAVPRGSATVSASMLLEVAPTGAAPVLAVTNQGPRYWLKWPGNPHGNVSLVNELVVARVGQLIGAPVRPIALVHVDAALVDGYFASGRTVPAGIHFGSELLPEVEETTEIIRVEKDGNAERFPRFLALWNLCMGTDLQLLYHVSNEHQVWSIDHGLWFDSHEGDWTPSLLQAWKDQSWSWPEGRQPAGLSARVLHDVASSVEELSILSLGSVVAEVPVEWGVPDDHLYSLAKFLHNRRALVAGELRIAAANYS